MCLVLALSAVLRFVSAGEIKTAIVLTSRDFAPHYDKYPPNHPLSNYGKYIQMRGWKREHLSLYATAEFTVEKTGWYEVWFNRRSMGATAEVRIDGHTMKYGKLVPFAPKKGYGLFKHFATYLMEGKHSMRLRSGGMFDRVELRLTDKPTIEDTLLITCERKDMTFRKGETVEFWVFGCPDKSRGKVTFEVRVTGAYEDRRLVHQEPLTFIGKKGYRSSSATDALRRASSRHSAQRETDGQPSRSLSSVLWIRSACGYRSSKKRADCLL